MAINYSFNSLNNQGPTVSYRNVSNQTLSFNINGTVYTVSPSNTLTLPESAAFDSGINNALSAGTLIKINVFGILPTSTPTGPAGESINSPIIATNVGGFSGVEEDSDGYWLLPSGNTIIYPLNKNFKHQKPGLNSIVSLSAAMRRTSIDIGNLGFAVYTDTKSDEFTFNNGYLVYWNTDGTGSVYRISNGVQYPLATTQESSYVMDEEFHRFSVYIYQTAPGQMEFFLYADGNLVSQSIDLDNGYTGGAVGFSTSQGTLPVYIQPGSFEIKHGAAEQAGFPTNLQNIINNSTVVVNTTGLSGVNLVPDSGFVFGTTYWDFGFAGTLTITNAVGVDGGNGVVYTQGASPGGPSSAIFFSTYGSDNALELINIPLKAHKQYCLSMNVNATNVTSGSPMIGIYSQDKTSALSTATQTTGLNNIIQCTYTPSVDTSIVVLCSMGDPLAPGDGHSANIPQLTANGTITFSCPQLELGSTRSNYVQTLVPNTSPNLNHLVLGKNPNPNTPPTVSGFTGFTYTDAGNITYTATTSFAVDQHFPSWLSGVGLYLTRFGSPAPTPNKSTVHTFLPLATGGTYNAIIHNVPTNLTASAAYGYNVYATYIDNQSLCSAVALVGKTVANPITIGNTTLAAGASGVTPTVSGFGSNSVSSDNATTFDYTASFALDSNGYFDNSNWLSSIELWAARTGTTKFRKHGQIDPQASTSATYTGIWGNLGEGDAFDLYVAYRDYKGQRSNLSSVIITVQDTGVGTKGLYGNPNPNTPPNITSSLPPSFAYTDAGSTSYDVEFSFTTNISNPAWLRSLLIYAVRSGSPAPNDKHKKWLTHVPPTSAGSYDVRLHHLPSATSHDLYLAYLDHAGGINPPTLIGTVTEPTLADPVLSSVGSPSYTDAGNVSFDVSFTLNLTPPSVKNHRKLLFTLVRHGGATPDSNTGLFSHVPAADSGVYTIKLKNVTSGVTGGWDVYAAYENLNRGPSNWVFITTLASNPVALPGTSLAQMPSGIQSAGPTISSSSATRTAKKGTLHEFSISFTETDFGSLPNWLNSIHLRVRNNGSTDHTHHVLIGANQITFGGGNGSATKVVHGALGQAHDFGFAYEDIAGNISATTWPSGVNNQTDPNSDFEDTSTGRILHPRHSGGVQGAIDTNSNILNNSFTGCKTGTDGTVTGVSSTGSASTQVHSFAAGQKITMSWRMQVIGSTSNTMRVVLGSTASNGYSLSVNSSAVILVKHVSGVGTTLGTIKTVAEDNNWHSGQLTITCNGASNNTIEGSWDDAAPLIISSSSVDLTSGTWAVTLYDGNNGTTKFSDIDIDGARPHHTLMSAGVQGVIDQSSNILSNNFANVKTGTDGTYFLTVTGTTSTQSRTYATGEKFTISGKFKVTTSTTTVRIGLVTSASPTIGYAFSYDNASARMAKFVAGTGSTINTLRSGTQDNNWHSFKLTIVCNGSSNNSIEYSFDDAAPNVFTDTSLDLTTGSWSIFIEDFSSGNVKFSDFKIEGARQHHTHMSGGVQTAINPSGQGLLVEFPSTVLNTDKTLTGFSNVGTTSTTVLSVSAGHIISFEGQMQRGTGSGNYYVLFGTFVNGYGFEWVGTNNLNIVKRVSSVTTNLNTFGTLGVDNQNPHHFKVSITVVGASNNNIEISFDNQQSAVINDTSFDFTTGTWPVTIVDPSAGTNGTSKYKHLKLYCALPHYAHMHIGHKADHDYTAGGDGTYLKAGKLTKRHHHGALSTDTNDAFDNDGVNSHLRYDTHHISHTSDHASSAGGDGTYLNSGKLTGRHHSGALSTDTSATMDNDGVTSHLLFTRHHASVRHDMATTAGTDGTYLNSGLITARHHLGANASDATSVWDASGQSFLHNRMSTGTQSALDHSGNFLNVTFPGARITSDGSLTNLTANWVSTEILTLVAGSVLHIEGHIQNNATLGSSNILLGVSDGTGANLTNGYAVGWFTAGGVQTFKKVTNVFTTLQTGVNLTQDHTYRPFKITITVNGTSNNTIEGSFDGQSLIPTNDTSLDLTSGSWFIFCDPGGASSKILNLRYKAAPPHYGTMHISHKSTHSATTNADGLYLNSGQVNDRHINTGQIKWKHMLGDTSGDAVTQLVDSNNRRFLHTSMSTGVQKAIGSDGRLLDISWGGNTGSNSDGSTTGFMASGSSSAQSYGFGIGHQVSFEGSFQMASTTALEAFILGNKTNGYGLAWNTSGQVNITKWVGGVATGLQTVTTVTQDTNVHSFKVTVVVGAINTIEASFDNIVSTIQSDSSLTLSSGTWPFTIVDSNNGTTKIWNFQAYTARQHHTHMSAGVQGAIDSSSNILNNNFSNIKTATDGTYFLTASAGSSIQSRTYAAGEKVTISGKFKLTSGTSTIRVGIGTSTNLTTGYAFTVDNSSARVTRLVSGVGTTLSTLRSTTQDTNWHSFKFTIVCNGASNNSIETSFDDVAPVINGADTGVDLTATAYSIIIVDSSDGNVKFSDFKIEGARQHHTHMSSGVQTAVNPSGQGLLVEFPSTVLNTDKSLTGFSNAGTTSTTVLSLSAGHIITFEGQLLRGGLGNFFALIGTFTNGYGFEWGSPSGNLQVAKRVSGVTTFLNTFGNLGVDTQNPHHFKISINVVGSANNNIECSFDNQQSIIFNDTSLDLTTGTWGITILDPNNGTAKLKHLKLSCALPHYSTMHAGHKSDTDYQVGGDGTYLKPNKLTKRHHSGSLSTDTNPAFDNDGVNSHLRYDTHHISHTSDHASSAGADGTYFNSGKLTARHHLGANASDSTSVWDASGQSFLHNRMSPASQATIDLAPGGDGSHLHKNTIARRHFTGDTSGGTENISDGSKLLHFIHSTQTQAVVSGTSHIDGLYMSPGQITGRHHQGADSNDTATMMDTGINNNKFVHTRHSVATQATITSAAGGDSSYLASGVITGRHHLGASGSDTTTVWDATGNAFIHNRMSAQSKAVIAGGVGADGIFLNSGQVNDRHINNNQLKWRHFLGDSSGDTSTNLVDTGLKRFLHTSMSSGVQTAIDSSGNLLNVSWSGIKVGSGGAMSGFSNTGTSSSNSFTIGANHIIAFEASFALASTTAQLAFTLGNTTNGYGINWATGGAVTVSKWVSGTKTDLGTIATVTQDTNVHSFKITIVQGASNTIEGGFDNATTIIQTDNVLTLTSGTWPFTILDGNNGTTKVWNFQAYSSSPHYNTMHAGYKHDHASTAGGDGTYLNSGLLTARHHSGALSTDTAATFNNDGSTSRLLHTRHSLGVQGAVDSNSNILNTEFAGTLLTTSGARTNFNEAAGGTSTTQVYTVSAGHSITYGCHFQLGEQPTTVQPLFLFGNTTNGYGLAWNNNGTMFITKWVSGIETGIVSCGTVGMDTNPHSILVTITQGTTNTIEASIDNLAAVITTDSSLSLSGMSLPFTIRDGNATRDMKVWNWHAELQKSHHTRMSAGTQAALDSIGNGLSIQFTNGAKYSVADDTITNVPNVSGSVAVQSRIYSPGEQFHMRGKFKVNSGTPTFNMGLGNAVNGYHIRVNSTTVFVIRIVNGTATSIGTIKSVPEDTNWHSFAITITVLGPSSNKIEATFDDNNAITIANDTNLDLTSGAITTWTPWLQDGNNGTTKWSDLQIEGAKPHHSRMSSGVQNSLDKDSNFLNSQFPGTKLTLSGAASGFANTAAGTQSVQQYILSQSQPFHVKYTFSPSGSAATPTLRLGDALNGYGFRWTTTNAQIVKYVNGTVTNLKSFGTGFQVDTNVHHAAITITPGATTNTIEGSLDGFNGSVADSTFTLPGSSLPISIGGLGNGFVYHMNVHGAISHHTHMSPGTQTAINSSGQGLLNEFPGTFLNTDGTVSGFSNAGTTSTAVMSASAGHIITYEGHMLRATGAAGNYFFLLGNFTNGYGFEWVSGGGLLVVKRVASVTTTLSNFGSLGNDAQNFHHFKVSITVNGASNNTIEVSFDNQTSALINDTSLDMSSATGSNGVTIVDSGNGTLKLKQFKLTSSLPHYSTMHSSHKSAINFSGQGLLNLFPGSVLKSDGSLSNVDGLQSTQTFAASANEIIHINGHITGGAANDNEGIWFGNSTGGGYGIYWSVGNIASITYAPNFTTFQSTGGTTLATAASASVPGDLAVHGYALTITAGATNSIEGSFDGNVFDVVTDNRANILASNNQIGILAGGSNGTLTHFKFDSHAPHYQKMHKSHTSDHDHVAGGDGTYLKANKLTARHHSGSPSTDTGDVMENVGGSAAMKFTRHHASVQHDMNSTAGADLTYLNSGILTARHHSGAPSTDTGAIMDNVSGTANLKLARHHANVQAAIVTSPGLGNVGAIVHQQFGSGVQVNPDGTISGVSSTGNATVNYPYAASLVTGSTGWEFSANIARATTAHTDVGIVIGSTTAGYGIFWRGSDGHIVLRCYNSGTTDNEFAIGVLQTGGGSSSLAIDTAVHNLRIAINMSSFINSGAGYVECYFDNGSAVTGGAAALFPVTFNSLLAGFISASTFFNGTARPFTLVDGNNGTTKFYGIEIKSRSSLLGNCVPVIAALNPLGPLGGATFNANTVDTNAIQNGAVGTSQIANNAITNGKISTNAIDFTTNIFANKDLDNVADGSTRFAVSAVNGSNWPSNITGGAGSTGGTAVGSSGPQIQTGSAIPSTAPNNGKGAIYMRTGGTNGTVSNLYCYNGTGWSSSAIG